VQGRARPRVGAEYMRAVGVVNRGWRQRQYAMTTWPLAVWAPCCIDTPVAVGTA